jgi:hypothetical protein
VFQSFGDDTLSYFTERLDPDRTREALIDTLRRAKRNKAFHNSAFLGLAIDGTSAGRSNTSGCALCRPQRNAKKEVIGYGHQLATISVVGTGLSLPFDAEPYGPGDSEYAAGQRLLARAVSQLGARFADYLVVDSAYATAPFLHAAARVGVHVVARLKSNLPELSRAVEKRFGSRLPIGVYHEQKQRIEIWDADDFDPWETLQWPTVRVIRYRQHKPDGSVVEADWLTDFGPRQISSLSLYHMAKSRWEIENQGFNDAKKPLRVRPYLSPSRQQRADQLVALLAGHGHRTPLSSSLPAPRPSSGALGRATVSLALAESLPPSCSQPWLKLPGAILSLVRLADRSGPSLLPSPLAGGRKCIPLQ